MAASKRTRTASQMGRYSRTKGAAFEREIANALKVLWPGARRGIGQARNAGEVPDVDGTPYWIETKHHKRVNIRKAYDQAVKAQGARPSREGGVLVISRDTGNRTDLATMSLDAFVAFVARLHRAIDLKVGA